MGIASLLLLLALAAAAGAAVVAAVEPRWRRPEPALSLVAGLVALHVLLLLFDLGGIPWRRGPLLLGWLVLAGGAAVLARWRRGASPERPRSPAWRRVGWGDGLAAVALAIYAVAAWTRRITIPDFIYHWGSKAKRYLLAGGVDYAFLTDPLRLTDHPDYPSLVPGLYATIGVVRGAFHERAALVVSVAFFALAVAATRRTVAVAGLSRPAGQGTTAAVALTLGMFGVGYRMAGAADWLIVVALLVALPALVGGRAPGGGVAIGDPLRLGLAAAIAAGAKIEGVPLAALLVAAGLVRWVPAWRSGWSAAGLRPALAGLARLLVPPLLVVLPWTIQNLRHGLFAAENTGPPLAARVPVVVGATLEVLATREWQGLPSLLLLLPLALAVPATRTAGTVLVVQGGFYAWVYLTSPVDTRFLVLSSLPRLLFHLVPPLVVLLAVVAFGRRGTAPPQPAGAPAAGGAVGEEAPAGGGVRGSRGRR